MVWSYLKQLLAPTPDVTDLDDLRTGYRVMTGVVRSDGEELTSPVARKPCVAFFYHATWKAPSRGGTTTRTYLQAEVYAPRYRLELDGGEVVVIPKKPGSFDPAEHARAVAAGLPGFDPQEQLLRVGDRIRLRGWVRRGVEELEVRPTAVEILAPLATPSQVPNPSAKKAPRPPRGKYHPRERRKAREARDGEDR